MLAAFFGDLKKLTFNVTYGEGLLGKIGSFEPLPEEPKNYTYYNEVVNGIELHIIKTPGSNIELKALGNEKTLKESGYFGCNGGWFSFKTANVVSNIAANNGTPVVSAEGNGGIGNYIGGETGGTIVYRELQEDLLGILGDVCGDLERGVDAGSIVSEEISEEVYWKNKGYVYF